MEKEISAKLSLFGFVNKNFYAFCQKGFDSVKDAEVFLLSEMGKIFNKHLASNIEDDEDASDENYNDKKTRIAYWLNENIKSCKVTV